MSESTTSTGISNPRLPNITSWAALKVSRCSRTRHWVRIERQIRKTIDTKIALC